MQITALFSTRVFLRFTSTIECLYKPTLNDCIRRASAAVVYGLRGIKINGLGAAITTRSTTPASVADKLLIDRESIVMLLPRNWSCKPILSLH